MEVLSKRTHVATPRMAVHGQEQSSSLRDAPRRRRIRRDVGRWRRPPSPGRSPCCPRLSSAGHPRQSANSNHGARMNAVERIGALKAKFRDGRRSDAVAECEALCKAEPGNIVAKRLCGMMHALMGTHARAIELLAEVN